VDIVGLGLASLTPLLALFGVDLMLVLAKLLGLLTDFSSPLALVAVSLILNCNALAELFSLSGDDLKVVEVFFTVLGIMRVFIGLTYLLDEFLIIMADFFFLVLLVPLSLGLKIYHLKIIICQIIY
jgi:hypothetical protein